MDVQTDLFKTLEECKFDALKLEVDKYKQSCDNVRRGLFARHNELAKMYLEQAKELEKLKKELGEIQRWLVSQQYFQLQETLPILLTQKMSEKQKEWHQLSMNLETIPIIRTSPR